MLILKIERKMNFFRRRDEQPPISRSFQDDFFETDRRKKTSPRNKYLLDENDTLNDFQMNDYGRFSSQKRIDGPLKGIFLSFFFH